MGNKQGPSGWKQMLIEATKLKGQSGENAWKRAKILCDVYASKYFRADNPTLDDFELASLLDEYCEDQFESFLELKVTFEFAPDVSEWRKQSPRRLRALAAEAEDEKRRERRESPTVHRIKRAEHEEVVRQRDQLKEFTDSLKETAQSQKTELERLREENRQLREQLAEAKGRISELERVLNRQLTAA